MLLHFILHWPQEARLELWPYAVDYAVWVWNHLPDSTTRLSPIEIFTKATFPDYKHLQRARVFGCPVYVLDPTLQDAKKLPKWQKRSWKGIFLGFSPSHHTNVALVLNPETGSITPQYHVVFDEKFSTISSNIHHDSTPTIQQWDSILDTGYDQHEVLQRPETLPPPDSSIRSSQSPSTPTETEAINEVFPESSPSNVEPSPESPTGASFDQVVPQDVPVQDIVPVPDSDEVPTPNTPTSAPFVVTPPIESTDSGMSSPPPRQTRSGRQIKIPARLKDFVLFNNMSKQTRFAPSRNLPKVSGEVLNRQYLSTL
jgi:hypothetical protein